MHILLSFTSVVYTRTSNYPIEICFDNGNDGIVFLHGNQNGLCCSLQQRDGAFFVLASWCHDFKNMKLNIVRQRTDVEAAVAQK